MEGQAKRSGEICCAHGCKTFNTFSKRFYTDEGTTYHRITRISKSGKKKATVMSSGNSWVAVQGEKSISFVGIAREKFDPLTFFPLDKPMAVVSMCLDTNDGSGFAASFTLFMEEVAVNLLENVFWSSSPLNDQEIGKAATSAFSYLCHENLKAKDFELCFLEKGNKIPMSLPCKDFRKSGKSGSSPSQSGTESSYSMCSSESSDSMSSSESSDSMTPYACMTSVPAVCEDVFRESMSTHACMTSVPAVCEDVFRESMSTHGKSRETHICCGGWDSRLLKSYGFSWITVQGKDSMCVVTPDEVTLGHGFFENVISHMEDNQLFGFKGFVDQSAKKSSMIRPFAAVSMVVGLHGESSHHRASIAEIKAIEFLMKKIKEASDFTYGGTVQTAISALLILTQKDLNPEEIKACALRNGEDLPFELLTTEIEEHLRVTTKSPEHLLTGEGYPSKKTKF